MVSPIRTTDPVRALAALIQRSVGRRAGNRAERRTNASKAGTRRREQILADIVERAHAIEPTNPERERLAMRLFIEGVLLAELGERHALEPAFHAMVREVEETLYNTPAIEADLKKAAQALVR
jgi:hypothetical protein